MKRYANLQALCGRDLERERANGQRAPQPCAVYTSSFVNKTWCYQLHSLYQGWRTYGTRAQKGTWKDFLGTRHSLLSQFCLISFARPASLHCEEYARVCACVLDLIWFCGFYSDFQFDYVKLLFVLLFIFCNLIFYLNVYFIFGCIAIIVQLVNPVCCVVFMFGY